jgi:hypothetical protein
MYSRSIKYTETLRKSKNITENVGELTSNKIYGPQGFNPFANLQAENTYQGGVGIDIL